jgi:diguanylate cyclase (GGDEF)-like protein
MSLKMFKNKVIFAYTLLALLPVIILPCCVLVYLPPKFNAFIINDTKTEAIRVANYLSSTIMKDANSLSNSDVISQLENKDAQLRKELQLIKLNLFLPTGEVIYSSSPEDIGKINQRQYFINVVAKGEAYSKWVKKDKLSLEGQVVQADVVETYVPIMQNGRFIGAFEIYYDITTTRLMLSQLTANLYVVLILISTALLGIIFFSAVKAKKRIDDQKFFQKKLHLLSITDDLTGLLNRRGFMTLGEKQHCLAKRTQQILLIAYSDIDGMKWINDNLGHDVGDRALKETAQLLKMTFRESDIISRLGGDEFAVLLSCDLDKVSIASIEKRFYENLKMVNQKPSRQYTLQVSLGVSGDSVDHKYSLEDLMTRADKLMYERKLRRKKASFLQEQASTNKAPLLVPVSK